MELRQFKYFVAIADCGSLSRAAQQLFIAQSALSKQMAELEAELGAQLLLRSRNGVAMTEAGKVFYEYAQGITKQVSDARAAVHVAADSVAGSRAKAGTRSGSGRRRCRGWLPGVASAGRWPGWSGVRTTLRCRYLNAARHR